MYIHTYIHAFLSLFLPVCCCRSFIHSHYKTTFHPVATIIVIIISCVCSLSSYSISPHGLLTTFKLHGRISCHTFCATFLYTTVYDHDDFAITIILLLLCSGYKEVLSPEPAANTLSKVMHVTNITFW